MIAENAVELAQLRFAPSIGPVYMISKHILLYFVQHPTTLERRWGHVGNQTRRQGMTNPRTISSDYLGSLKARLALQEQYFDSTNSVLFAQE